MASARVDANPQNVREGTTRPLIALDPPAAPTCPTCGCAVHPQPRTWEVVCSTRGEKRWPLAVVKPAAYLCARCQVTSPAKRAAGQKSAASRRGRAPR